MLALGVLAAIQFEDQFGFIAKEVGNVAEDGNLAPEFEADKPTVPEKPPELFFRFCGISA